MKRQSSHRSFYPPDEYECASPVFDRIIPNSTRSRNTLSLRLDVSKAQSQSGRIPLANSARRSEDVGDRGFSQEFVLAMEARHRDALARAHNDIRNQESDYEIKSDQLKSRISNIREKISLQNENHERDLVILQEQYQSQKSDRTRENTTEIKALSRNLNDLKLRYEEEVQKTQELQETIANMKLEHSQEIEELTDSNESLNAEIAQLRHKYYTQAQEELERLEKEKEEIVMHHEENFKKLKQEHEENIMDLTEVLESKNMLVKNLEFQIEEHQKRKSEDFVNVESNLHTARSTLQSSQRIVEAQEQDIARMKNSREDTRRENRILHKENANLESELIVLRKDNGEIRKKILYLEKMIYGKHSRKNSDGKARRSRIGKYSKY